MGLSPQLAVILLCFLACTGNRIQEYDDRPLRELITILNQVTKEGTPCTEMLVPDVLTAKENTTQNELICRASKVLRKFYSHRELSLCLKKNPRVLNELRRAFRATNSQNPLKSCTGDESTFTTLKNFLERLKTILREKFWQS